MVTRSELYRHAKTLGWNTPWNRSRMYEMNLFIEMVNNGENINGENIEEKKVQIIEEKKVENNVEKRITMIQQKFKSIEPAEMKVLKQSLKTDEEIKAYLMRRMSKYNMLESERNDIKSANVSDNLTKYFIECEKQAKRTFDLLTARIKELNPEVKEEKKARKTRKLIRQKIKKRITKIEQMFKSIEPAEMKQLKQSLKTHEEIKAYLTGAMNKFNRLQNERNNIKMENESVWNESLNNSFIQSGIQADHTFCLIVVRMKELSSPEKKEEKKFYHGPILHVSTVAAKIADKYKNKFKKVEVSKHPIENHSLNIIIDDIFVFKIDKNTTINKMDTAIKRLLGDYKCNICCNTARYSCFCRHCDNSCCTDCYEQIIRKGSGVTQCPYCRAS